MTNILIGKEDDFKIHYHHALTVHDYDDWNDVKCNNKMRSTVREILSLVAGNQDSLPGDLNEVMYYSEYFGKHVTVSAPELVEDFIKHKRSKFRYDYTTFKPYRKPDEDEFISYFIRALQSLKTRLETCRDAERLRRLEATVARMQKAQPKHAKSSNR